jgi:glycosyltransferase involved in cell wall biosynthesis
MRFFVEMNITTPEVSVIMPTYNCSLYIGEAVDSVLCQTYQNFELIIVDDGSTDETQNVLQRYKNDPRIKYERIKHSGKPSIARNIAIQMASGKYIAFCDADDIFFENMLSHKIEFYQRYPDAGFIFTDYVNFHATKGNKNCDRLSYFQKQDDFKKKLIANYIKDRFETFYLFTPQIRQHLLAKLFVHTSTVMVPKYVIEKVGRFNETLIYGEDWDLWLRILKKYPCGYIDDILCYKRIWEKSLTMNQRQFLIKSMFFQKRFLKTEPLSSEHIKLIKQSLSVKAYAIGYQSFKEGNTMDARRWFWESVCNNPTGWKQLKYLLFTLLGDYFLLQLRKIKWKIQGVNSETTG